MSPRQLKPAKPQTLEVTTRLGRARPVPFPVYVAHHVSTRAATFGTVQITFYYVPVIDELYEAMTPGAEPPTAPIETEACVTAQVVMPKEAFNAWFEEMARNRGLLPATDEGTASDESDGRDAD